MNIKIHLKNQKWNTLKRHCANIMCCCVTLKKNK